MDPNANNTNTDLSKNTQDPPPAENPAAANPTAGGAQGAPAGTQAETKFTQADLDRIAGQTRKDAKSAERAALLKELGVADLDAAKKAITTAEEARKAQMTEIERLQQAKEESDRKLAASEAARQKAEQYRKEALLTAAVVGKASGKFANPQAVVKLADLTKVTLGDDGQFTGIDEALERLATQEPWTLAKTGITVPSLGATNGSGKPKSRTDEDRRAEYFGGGNNRKFFDEGGVVTPKQ